MKRKLFYAYLILIINSFFLNKLNCSSNEDNQNPFSSKTNLSSPLYPPELITSQRTVDEIRSLPQFDSQRGVYYTINDELTDNSIHRYLINIEHVSRRSILLKQKQKLSQYFDEISFKGSSYEILEHENLNDEDDTLDITKRNLRIVWKKKTNNGRWPKYRKDILYTLDNERILFRKKKSFYDVYFIIPLSVGGPMKWWNVFPLTPYQIQYIKNEYPLFYFLFENSHCSNMVNEDNFEKK